MALTKEQKQYIKDNYLTKTHQQIADDLGITLGVVRYTTAKLNLRKAKDRELNPQWTKEEIDFLLKNKDVYSRNALSKILNHSPSNVIKKLKELGVEKKSFSKVLLKNGNIIEGNSNSGNFLIDKQEDIDFIIKNINELSMKRICEHLKCSYHTVYRICERYNIDKQRSVHDITGFSKQEIRILKENFDKMDFNELCKMLPRWSESSILRKCKNLKLFKKKCTYPELVFESILKRLNIEFTTFVKVYYDSKHYYEIDFVVKNIAFEIQGDYWHCNPQVFSDKTKWTNVQRKMIQRDKEKKMFLESKGFVVVYIWENDLKKDIDFCIKTVLEYCSLKNP